MTKTIQKIPQQLQGAISKKPQQAFMSEKCKEGHQTSKFTEYHSIRLNHRGQLSWAFVPSEEVLNRVGMPNAECPLIHKCGGESIVGCCGVVTLEAKKCNFLVFYIFTPALLVADLAETITFNRLVEIMYLGLA
ncbi:hypothetical protein JHK85_045772 [Glycine max]|nr:hypothetical protein JHK85_045772 [Glycine max]